jgi:hypothetical protein
MERIISVTNFSEPQIDSNVYPVEADSAQWNQLNEWEYNYNDPAYRI